MTVTRLSHDYYTYVHTCTHTHTHACQLVAHTLASIATHYSTYTGGRRAISFNCLFGLLHFNPRLLLQVWRRRKGEQVTLLTWPSKTRGVGHPVRMAQSMNIGLSGIQQKHKKDK